MSNLYYGENQLLNTTHALKATVNPASQFIMMPLSAFKNEKNKILNGLDAKCVDGVCTIPQSCSDVHLEDMHVTLSDDIAVSKAAGSEEQVTSKVFQIPGNSLKIDESTLVAGGTGCTLGLAGYDDHQGVILGSPFMENYYTVMDVDEHQIGFGLSVQSNGGIYEEG